MLEFGLYVASTLVYFLIALVVIGGANWYRYRHDPERAQEDAERFTGDNYGLTVMLFLYPTLLLTNSAVEWVRLFMGMTMIAGVCAAADYYSLRYFARNALRVR